MLKHFLIVGGASAYTPGLVKALIADCHRHDLELVRLYDIADDRLKLVANLCRKMARAAGAPFEVEATTNRRVAVRDIDILLNSSRPGGFECRRNDEALPLEFDVPGQETVGPGGFFFAMRSIPAALELADDVAQQAPDAIWLNYTNPTNIVAQALRDRTELNVIALCDQFEEDLHSLADALGFPDDVSVDFSCSGLNHATWYHNIRFDGSPLPDRAYEVSPPDYFDEEHKARFVHCAEMAARYDGRWPNSYLPYYESPKSFVKLLKKVKPRSEVILEGLDEYYRHFEEESRRDKPQLEHHRGSSGFGDMAVDVLAALSSEEPVDLVLNIPNRGLIGEFDDATVVESFVSVSSDGVVRTAAPPIPQRSRALLKQLETYQRRTAQAAVTGRFKQMMDALSANPLVDSSTMASDMLERARSAYEDWIPQLSP